METSSSTYNIFFDRVIDAVVMDWRGYSTSQEFRKGTEIMLDLLVKNQTFKVLANTKDMTIIGQEDQEWLDKVFLPKATDLGFKVLAIVKPDHHFNQVAIESISYKVDKNKLAIQFFNNSIEAKEWLNLIENPNKN